MGIFASMLMMLGLHPQPVDSARTLDLLKAGGNLSAGAAATLEDRIRQSPDDEEALIQLLAYYAGPPADKDLSAVKAARVRHILWLIEHDPKDGFGLFNVETGVYRLHCTGDDLADAAAFNRAEAAWLEQIAKNPGNSDIRRAAIDAIQFCAPERAAQILTEAQDEPGLGRLYAATVLGITGESYLNNDPLGSDPALREGPVAKKQLRLLEEATDKDLLVAAAVTLFRYGAMLPDARKLDWDYRPLANRLLAEGIGVSGEVVRVLPRKVPSQSSSQLGGPPLSPGWLRKVAPSYPSNARHLGIQGTVTLTALIGVDGRILYLDPETGPPELTPASIEAVRQWVHKAALLNGKPCYILTQIDVNFALTLQ